MTRDEHVRRILTFVFEELGVEAGPGKPFYDATADTLFILIDHAIGDGIRQGRYAQTETPSAN